MRNVASIRLTCRSTAVFDDSLDKLNSWVRSKGVVDLLTSPPTLTLVDGRPAKYEEEDLESGLQRLHACRITEPTETGPFKTSIELSRDEYITELACRLYVGGLMSTIAPIPFDARCPRVVRDIVGTDAVWLAGETPVSLSALAYRGQSGGSNLCDLIWSQSRHLPLAVVSEHQGLILHPDLPNGLAHDLCGLAIVATVDDAASREVTRTRTREWSCYNGAIRIYWPMLSGLATPRQHPLWTAERLLSGVPNTFAAAARIRAQIRRRVFGLSTFAHTDRSLGESVRIEKSARTLVEMRKLAVDSGEWQQLAEEVDRKNGELSKECDNLREQVADLKARCASLLTAVQWQSAEGYAEDVVPEEAAPPATVIDAVNQAREKHGDCLLFGSDVEDGIVSLHPTAGPPEKILRYLDVLAEMTRRRANGTLGTDPLMWLNAQGIAASGEGETVRKSKAERQKRTWNAGTSSREFLLHLKPAEATDRGRCARIYFDHYESTKTIVGWIGPHP